ncbi:MAG: ATP-binding cassette domain-containing protein, partial [Spartobacteria bacterium]
NGAGKSTLLKILSRVTTQTEGRIARVRAGDRSWKVADRCNQAAGRPRGRLPLGSPKGESRPWGGRERLPLGSSVGGAGWENLRIK